uniref:Uncharacterized protein n=1 Tax=Phoenicurus auroreus parvoviridae sp. TaxID=2794531 RepID=A0A8A4XCX5_9VIRU|nr:MAG: hypothetical protein [Phoenicurus auroreus parvoviridae sp.]
MSNCSQKTRQYWSRFLWTPNLVHQVPTKLSWDLKRIGEQFPNILIGGGFPTWLFGLTTLYGDIDVYVPLQDVPNREFLSCVYILQTLLPHYKFSEPRKSPGYKYMVVDCTFDTIWLQIIIVDAELTTRTLFDSYDLSICKNLIHMKDGVWQFSSEACGTNSNYQQLVNIKKHMIAARLSTIRRSSKYLLRYAIPSLQFFCSQQIKRQTFNIYLKIFY